MAIEKSVLTELTRLADKSRVFLSMPWVEGLTPQVLGQEGRYESVDAGEGLERRHGIFHLNEAALSPLDHGGLYGDACFEGILIQHQNIFVFKEHLKRWWASAAKLGISFPYEMTDMAEWILRLVNEVDLGPNDRGYLRPILTRGFGNLGIHPRKCIAPTIYIIASTITLYPPERYETGIDLAIARNTRRPDRSIVDPNIKSCNYLNNINGLLETLDRGTLETLMLTSKGNIAEATADNIFLIRRQKGWEEDPSKVLIETPVSDYCLEGITRNLVIQEARSNGYRLVERPDMLPIDLVGEEKEVFMTGTGAGIMPIVGVAGVPVGDSKPGPITKGLLAQVRARMTDPAYALSIKSTRKDIEAYLEAPNAVTYPMPR